MASYFIDLDGVFFKFGSMEPNENAINVINELMAEGHEVIFTTKRKVKNNIPKNLNIIHTKRILKKLRVSYTDIVTNVSSPRYIVNDEGAVGINHIRNFSLSIPIEKKSFSLLTTQKVKHALLAMAWTAWKYGYAGDADDYIQTIIVAQSLIHKRGFCHEDIVKRYRSKQYVILHDHQTGPGGVLPEYRGQIFKLVSDRNPRYQAAGGVSDGAAMKVLPLAVYYRYNFKELILNTDSFTAITHNTVEARLAAVLLVLRYRQVLLAKRVSSISDLLHDFDQAIAILGVEKESKFFRNIVHNGAKITTSSRSPGAVLYKLAKTVGINHLSWSAPVSACFWSFRIDENFVKWFHHDGEHFLKTDSVFIESTTQKTLFKKRSEDYLRKIGHWEDFMNSHGHHWGKSLDLDTFFSLTFSIVAMQKGTSSFVSELPMVTKVFMDDLDSIAYSLVTKKVPFHMYTYVLFIQKIAKYLKFSLSQILSKSYGFFRLNLGIKKAFIKFIHFNKYT